MNPDEFLLHRRTLNKSKSIWILGFGFANPNSFQKIRFVDLFCPTVFNRFVLWIRFVDSFCRPVLERFASWICFVASFRGFVLLICFVKTKIPNYVIHFVLEGFVYNSRILTYNSFNQYIITPLSLVWPPTSSSTLRRSSADAIWRSDTERLSSSTKDTLDSNHHHNCCWSEINNDPIRHLFNWLSCNSELLMAHYTFCNTCKNLD
jgi:hypothetical protein